MTFLVLFRTIGPFLYSLKCYVDKNFLEGGGNEKKSLKKKQKKESFFFEFLFWESI